ncbi:MAG: FIST N-terminal domain-containing protein [Actinomycetota bacterium]
MSDGTGPAADDESGRRFAAALSRHPEPAAAVAEVIGRLGEELPAPPSLVMVFASGAMIDSLDDVLDAFTTLLTPDVLIGTTAVGVVAGGEEVESADALSAWAATGVDARPLRLEALPGPLLTGLPDRIEPGSTLVVLADPYTYPVDALVDHVNDDHPGVAVVGGLSSAPGGPGRNRLLLDDHALDEGAVAVLLPPGVATPVVSQGCRPIGSPWVITEAEGQLVRTLGGRPAMERLSDTIEELADADRAIAARGLHAGLVANDRATTFDQGDFLIRGVLGAERASGAVAIGDRAEVGQVLQFQVRDEESASRELDRLLAPVRGRGAIVFTCNGRGSHLFSTPNHDASRVSDAVGPAVAGMFCAGELGPIAERNALHGFTATVLAFD